jgi:hypothetical protein
MTRDEYAIFRNIRSNINKENKRGKRFLSAIVYTDTSSDHKIKLHKLLTDNGYFPFCIGSDSIIKNKKPAIVYIDYTKIDGYASPGEAWERLTANVTKKEIIDTINN